MKNTIPVLQQEKGRNTYKDFADTRDRKVKKIMQSFGPDLRHQFDPEVGDKSAEGRRFLEEAIVKVKCEPYGIAEFALRCGKPLAEMEYADLDISPTSPMFETTVLFDPEKAQARDVLAHLMKNFGDPKMPVGDVGHPQHYGSVLSRGTRITLVNSDYAFPLTFRVNSAPDEARSRRGIMSVYEDGVIPNLRDTIAGILRDTAEDHSTTVAVAREVLLRPTVTVYTPDHKPITLPQGATVLDFAAEIHTDLLLGIQTSYASRDAHGTQDKYNTYLPMSIFEPVEDGMTIKVDSCLSRGKRDYSRVIADPGWILFCTTEKAKQRLRRYLSKNETSGATTDDVSMVIGEQYVSRIADLFSVDESDILVQLFEKTDSTDTLKLINQVGAGEIDIVKLLALEDYQNQKEWHFDVILPDTESVLHDFTDEFKKQKLNLLDPNFVRIDDKTMRYSGKFVDRTGKKSPYDIMKIMLKLSYYYELRVSRESIAQDNK